MTESSVPFREAAGFLGMKSIHINDYERGVLWVDGECKELLKRGSHRVFDPTGRKRMTAYDRRAPWLTGDDKDLLLASGIAGDELATVDLADYQRALVRQDGRFSAILGPGVHAWWKGLVDVRVAVKDIRENNGVIDVREAPAMFSTPEALSHFSVIDVPAGTRTAFFRNGDLAAMLSPGRHAFWLGSDAHTFQNVDMREQTMDVNGQELLTSDKLTIRINAVLSYRIGDPEKYTLAVSDAGQALYREAQLALRAEVNTRELEALLSDRRSLSADLAKALADKTVPYGVDVASFGVRDVILPGDVRSLLLKATEARKTSEAATIVRREETAAMRHQLNTARILADNPALMRLRELETVEKLAAGGKLTVIVGDKGVAEKVADMM